MQQFLEENSSMRELHMVRARREHHELYCGQAADFERILRAVGGNPHLQVFSFPGMDGIHADSIESLLNSTSIRTLRIELSLSTLHHESTTDQLANAFAANRTIENLTMRQGPIRALASMPCLRQLTLEHPLTYSDVDGWTHLLINSESLNVLAFQTMYYECRMCSFFWEYFVNAPLIRLRVLRCSHVMTADSVALAECLKKAVHLRELHIGRFFYEADCPSWLKAMRENATLYRVLLSDGTSATTRTLVEAYSLSNRMLPVLISKASLNSQPTDETEHIDSNLIPSVFACTRAISRTGKSMVFLSLLSMGESIELMNARQRRCTRGRQELL
jgi:hypothetical protein